jgi:hypothetical protein
MVAKDSPRLIQMVYAKSGSTSADGQILQKVERTEGNQLSPNAVTN